MTTSLSVKIIQGHPQMKNTSLQAVLETFESAMKAGRSPTTQKYRDQETGKVVRVSGVRDSTVGGDGEESIVGGGPADGTLKRAQCLTNDVNGTVRYLVITNSKLESSEGTPEIGNNKKTAIYRTQQPAMTASFSVKVIQGHPKMTDTSLQKVLETLESAMNGGRSSSVHRLTDPETGHFVLLWPERFTDSSDGDGEEMDAEAAGGGVEIMPGHSAKEDHKSLQAKFETLEATMLLQSEFSSKRKMTDSDTGQELDAEATRGGATVKDGKLKQALCDCDGVHVTVRYLVITTTSNARAE